jgi:hypothetical protein
MFFGGKTAARRARRPGTAGPPTGWPIGWPAGRASARTVALVVAATAGAGLVSLAVVAWTTPRTVAVTRPVTLEQSATITYDASARRSAAYPTGHVRTGDPVFLRLVPTMDVQIGYRATVDFPVSGTGSNGTGLKDAGLSGTRRVTAELRSPNGWHRGFELLPRAEFSGGGFAAVASIDLARVRALVTGVERATGISDSRFTLSVRSEIALTGTIPGARGGTAIRDSFFPELTFDYDAKQLQLAGVEAPVTEVVRSRSSAIPVPGREPNQLAVLGLDLPIGPLRAGGLVAGLALLVAAGLVEQARRKARHSAPDRIVRRIVLADSTAPAGPATRPARSRPRVPGPRTAALTERQPTERQPTERQWPRPNPGPRNRD